MTKTPQPFSIRMDADLKAELQKLADDDDRSLTRYVTRILRSHVEAKAKQEKRK